jgi:hypothetical protein
MYYNINEEILLTKIPKNLIKEDGSIFINFYLSDINTLSDYGYYTIRNDNKEPPNNNSIEILSEQQIVLDKPYVDIIRKWLDVPVKNDNIPSPPAPEPIINEDV